MIYDDSSGPLEKHNKLSTSIAAIVGKTIEKKQSFAG
jgi:hypothetical protein